jgi:hypothetical protein
MDGGKRQAEMAERVKGEVKRGVKRRRGGRGVRGVTRQLEGEVMSGIESPSGDVPRVVSPDGSVHTHLVSIVTPPDSVNLTETPQQSDASYPIFGLNAARADTSTHSDFEPSLLMSYLDYAFPILFPFYKPSVLEGGRSWLLALALQHPAFYHNVIGLAAYFYCAVPVLPGPEHDACVVKAQAELQGQMEKAVQGVQDGLKMVTQIGVQNALADSVRLLGNIVQLVNFEVVFASSENWQMHLNAAVELFLQMLRHHGRGCTESIMSVILEKLHSHASATCSVWSAEQAAFRFFAAMLLYQDIIASTALEQAPRLQDHYEGLLMTNPTAADRSLLKLEDFTGCKTWILTSIAATSALHQWKKDSKRTGTFDVLDLVARALPIRDRLTSGLAALATQNTTERLQEQQELQNPYRPLESILAASHIPHGSPADTATHNTISTIWAHAASLYLHLVLSGHQPANASLRAHVASILHLLSDITNPSWLRSLAWPFCIAGCLAQGEEEQEKFREVAGRSGALGMFGTVRDAVGIMEGVWRGRAQGVEEGEVGAWLRMGIRGGGVLLV